MNLGFYHESNIALGDHVNLTLGLRYDLMHTSIKYDSQAFMTMAATVMGIDAAHTLRSVLDGKAKDDYQQLLPKLGINYQIDHLGSNLYITVSKATEQADTTSRCLATSCKASSMPTASRR